MIIDVSRTKQNENERIEALPTLPKKIKPRNCNDIIDLYYEAGRPRGR